MKQQEFDAKLLFNRTPIFNRDKSVFAYKLNLNFDDLQVGKSSMDRKKLEESMGNILMDGMELLSQEKKVFINLSREMLESGYYFKFPSEKLEGKLTIDVNLQMEGVNKPLKKYKGEMYSLMLDEKHLSNPEMIEFAEFVSVDFRNKELCRKIIKKMGKYKNLKLIAIGVDTHYDFEDAKLEGFDYFLGDFFLRPDILPLKEVSVYKTNIFKIIKELNRKTMEIKRIEKILQTDVSLTVKLLKFINSSKFGLKTNIESIPHALRLLGENQIKNWLLIIVLASSIKKNVEDVVRTTVFRAKFCELMAVNTNLRQKKEQFFLLGMLSMLDVYMSRTMEELLEEFSIDTEIKNALLRTDENQYSDILDLVLDYERSEWTQVKNSMNRIRINNKTLGDIYLEALTWSQSIEDI
jgi:EAL and modified HD-GYP domain-containing signal transduction protein